MARPVFVTLGGKARELRYTTREAIELKRRFGKTPKRLIYEDLAPRDEFGNLKRDTDPEVIIAFLFLGMRHDRKVTEDDVLNWHDAFVKDPETGGVQVLVGEVIDAALLSGFTGESIDLEKVKAAKAAEAEDEPEASAADTESPEGKAVRPPDNP